MRHVLIVALGILLPTSFAFGWGKTGHRVVGDVAQGLLTHKAEKEIKVLLNRASMASVADWADFIKSDENWRKADPWHYANVPDGKTYAESVKNPAGDVVVAIQKFSVVLADPKRSKDERAEALRFLIHFVGDIHQPMHMGREDDRGGNDVLVTFMGGASNLHRVWDEDLINFQQLSFSEYADMIRPSERHDKVEIQDLQKTMVEDWAQETLNQRKRLYDGVGDGKLSYRYSYDNLALLNRQLRVAGIRLAGLLNQLLK